jgi:hypothetical protein
MMAEKLVFQNTFNGFCMFREASIFPSWNQFRSNLTIGAFIISPGHRNAQYLEQARPRLHHK